MIIECTECGSRYLVPDGAIGADGRTVRCANCKHSWFQPPAVSELMARAREKQAESVARAAVATPPPAPPQARAAYTQDEWADDWPARRNPARRWTMMALAAGVAMTVAAVGVLWSGQAGIAASLGLPLAQAASPLQFADKAIDRRDLTTGNELFAVSGKVVNPTDQRQRIPDIRADLRDAQGRPVYSWTITPERRFIGPKGQLDFNSAKLDVPGNVKELKLSFAGDGAS